MISRRCYTWMKDFSIPFEELPILATLQMEWKNLSSISQTNSLRGTNMYLWEKYRVNYVLIFNFDPRNQCTWRHMFAVCFGSFFLTSRPLLSSLPSGSIMYFSIFSMELASLLSNGLVNYLGKSSLCLSASSWPSC